MEINNLKFIEAKPKSVREILDKKEYTLDYYQREYLWQTRQMQELINDLSSKFLENYKPSHQRRDVKNYPGYFLGPIIINEREGQMSIVDGQQRLTSLTLLLIYLNHLQENYPNTVQIGDLIYSEKYGEKSFNLDINDRKECMSGLLEKGEYTKENNNNESIKTILNRYQEIQGEFPNEINDKVLPYFIDWLTEKVFFVEILTFSEQDAYTIFETMNDRGINLSASDMLKGYILTKSPSEKRKELDEIWRENKFKLEDVGDSDEFDEFLKAFFRAKYAKTIRQGKEGAENEDFEKIGTRFHQWFRENEKSIISLNNPNDFANFIKTDLVFFSDKYKRIIDYQDQFNNQFEEIYNINSLGLAFSIFYPFLMAPITLNDVPEIIDKKLRLTSTYLEFFIVFRALNSKRYQQSSVRYTMYSLTKEIRNKNIKELEKIFKDRVSGMGYKIDGVNNLSMNGQNRNFIRFILAKITSYIEKKSDRGYSFKEYWSNEGKDSYDIEHILSKNSFAQYKNEFDSEEEFEDYRNKIGGLLLLRSSVNRSYGDKSYEEKVEHYYSENLLASSLYYKCYENNPRFLNYIGDSGLNFKPYEHFGKAAIEERQALYEEILKSIYNVDIFSKIVSE